MGFIYPRSIRAVSAIGSTWDATWHGLLHSFTRFTTPPKAYAWPVGPLMGLCSYSDIDEPAYSARLYVLFASVVGQVKTTVHKAVKEYHVSRVAVFLSSSHGDPAISSSLAMTSMNCFDYNLYDKTMIHFKSILDDVLCIPLDLYPAYGACASGLIALLQANEYVNMHHDALALIVSIDSASLVAYIGFKNVGAMAPVCCKPFTSSYGMSVGEGAVAMLLSSRSNTSTDYAVEVLGGDWRCDGSLGVEPSSEGLTSTVNKALLSAGLTPQQIDFVFWHGTGTKRSDRTELEVAMNVWESTSCPVSSATKGNLGHTMGASASFNIAAAYASLIYGVLPPLPYKPDQCYEFMNLVSEDPLYNDYVHGLCIAMGFGGINGALVLRRTKGA